MIRAGRPHRETALPRDRRQAALLAGALLAGAGELVAIRYSAAPPGITHRRFGLLANLAGAWAAFALAAALLLRLRSTRLVVVVALVLGVALRVDAITPKAPLSDDLYRYAWDGLVQDHGIDPYRYPPLDPALAGLRTSGWLFPAGYTDGTRINRPRVRTIYPPVAEAWFAVVHATVPLRWHDRGLELAGLATDLAVLAALLALLRDQARRIAGYALCPLPVVEAVQNAHVDALAVLGVLLMLLALRAGRGGRAALALAAATLVKIYPVLLLPVLLRAGGRAERGRRLAIFGAAVAAGYLPHVLAVGPRVLGYLPGYLHEEGYGGGRYLLVGLLGLPGPAGAVLAAAGLLAVAAVAWRRRPGDALAALWLVTAALLLATPVQPWYALLLVALATVTGRWVNLGVAAGAYPGFFGAILRVHPAGLGRLGYGLAGGVLALSPAASRVAGRRGRAAARRRTPASPPRTAPAPGSPAPAGRGPGWPRRAARRRAGTRR